MRLRNKFILLISTILILTLGLNTYYFVQRQRTQAMAQLHELGRVQGELLALIAPDAILGYDFVRLNEYVEQVTRQSDIVFAVILDTEGRALTSFMDGDAPAVRQVLDADATAGPVRVLRALEQTWEISVQRYPILQEQRPLGSAVIAVDRSAIERTMREVIVRQMAIYTGIILLLSMAIYMVFKFNVLRPVTALIRASRRIARGDYEQKVERYSDDELGTLTDAFNAMMAETRREQELLNYQANYDPLTGLANRSMATERIRHEIEVARRNGSHFALMFIDLDHFKLINDTYGHAVGDRLLVEVSGRFSQQVRAVDLLARLGGDEYLVLLPGCDSRVLVQNIAERLTRIADEVIHIDDVEIRARCSVGIAFFPQDGETTEELMAAADSAMYAAKRDPVSAIRFYTGELSRNSKLRVELERSLHLAFERREFHIAYQPVVRSSDKRCVGVEALLRWTLPEHGPVSPAEFIPVAESSGQIIQLGNWVLEQACGDLARLRREGFDPGSLSLNISRSQLRPGFERRVLDALKHYGLPPDRLVLELTESVLLEEKSGGIGMLEKWRAAGIRLSLDDFGTGFSSLSYLKRFDFDILKIDKSFVDGVPDDHDSVSLINAIVGIGASLGMEVVAEGVESEQQYDFFRYHDTLIQGYYFARPMPLTELRRYLHANAQWREPSREPTLA